MDFARTTVPDPSIIPGVASDCRDEIAEGLVLSSEPLGWSGVTAKRFRHAPGEQRFATLPADMASVYLGEPVRSVRWSDDGDAVRHGGLAMLAEVEAGGPGGKVYGDALATALATHLLRSHGTSLRAIADAKGGLR